MSVELEPTGRAGPGFAGTGHPGPSPEYEKTIAAMDQERAGALVLLEEPINQGKAIADLAAGRRLPTVFPTSMADAGGLFAHGTPLREAARHMARHADKILNGSGRLRLPRTKTLQSTCRQPGIWA